MNLTPKLIFFDIDGTLLNRHGEYSPRLKVELLRLKEHGVKLAIASGRPAIAAQFLFDDLPVIDAGLFCTGAEIYNPATKEHLLVHLLSKSKTEQLYEDVKAQSLYCEFYTTDFYTTAQETELSKIHSAHLRVLPHYRDSDRFLMESFPITKLLLGAEEVTQGRYLREFAKKYSEYFEFAFARFLAYPGWLFASVISKAADKTQGFDWLADFHQVTAPDVMAFGDSHSDTVFLQKAGFGVAMGNALPEIKAQANMTTGHCDDDGVAQILSQLYR